MKKILISTLLVTTIANSAIADHAFLWSAPKPYVGINAQVRRMDFKGGFGDNLLQHHSPQGNIYFGLKLNQHMGLEFGYEATRTRTRQVTTTTGDVVSGMALNAALSPAVFKSKAKLYGPHMDVVGFYSFEERSPVQLIGSVGFSYLKGAYERRTISVANMQSSTVRKLSNRKLILRLNTGVQYMLGEHFGLRATLGWINTGRMLINAQDGLMPNAPKPELKPKNSVVYALGALWAF